MISVPEIVAAFRNIVGWPYATPGSNDERGLDCSGAFVYAYRLYGESIYHGSNRIIRVYCHDVRDVTTTSALRVGMAIFKSRADLSQMSSIYKPGGRYYDPALPYDYYHVGLVTSVNPLQIINATPPAARIDTNLRPWCCAGYLNAVQYDEPPVPPEPPKRAIVTAPSGSTVNLRAAPSLDAVVRARVPLCSIVEVLSAYDETWWQVRYENVTGYMMREFLLAVE